MLYQDRVGSAWRRARTFVYFLFRPKTQQWLVTEGQEILAGIQALARHLEWPLHLAQAAVNYIEAFPEEIAEALAENDAMDFTALKRMLPNIQRRVVHLREDDVEAAAG